MIEQLQRKLDVFRTANPTRPARYIYLGRAEWFSFVDLCHTRNLSALEQVIKTFEGATILRVDAPQHFEVG